MFSKSAQKEYRNPHISWALFSVFMVGLNLRPAITSIAPVLKFIEIGDKLNALEVGLLTSIPLLIFVFLSNLVPSLFRSIGYSKAIMWSLVILLISFFFRYIHGTFPIFASMAIAGVAISIGNVLLPAYIKQEYTKHAGILTAIYTVSLYLGPALTAVATLPLMDFFKSWRLAIIFWGVLVFAAMPLWYPHVKTMNSNFYFNKKAKKSSNLNLWRDPLAWSVTLYFSILSMLFYTISAWLPTILANGSMSLNHASQMLSLVNISAIPFALFISIIVYKISSQVWVAVSGSILLILGLFGILISPSHLTVIWMIIFGVGHGTATGVAYSLPLLRSRSSNETAMLGGMSQSVGYTLAALGPATAGILCDLTHNWRQILLIILISFAVIQAIAGLFAGRSGRFVNN